MSHTIIPLTVNANTRKQVRPDNMSVVAPPSQRPVITAEEMCVLALHFVDNNGNDYPLGESDTFELGGDINFIHWLAEGALAGSLTAGNTVTSIAAKSGLATFNIPDTGHIYLRNSAGNTERVEYTAFSSATLTFTVNHLLIYSYTDGNVLNVEDELMFYSGNDQVDVAGDWIDIDRAAGKVSIRVDATGDRFKEKITSSTGSQEIYVEIRRYVAGSATPSLMYGDRAFAQNTVINGLSNPAATSIQFLTATAASALLAVKADKVGTDDIEITDPLRGTVYTDRTTGMRYRLYVDNGIIGIESVI